MIIVSGHQTGADIAGIDWARSKGLTAWGFIPEKRLCENGSIPDNYLGIECGYYPERTLANILVSNVTICFARTWERGTKLTVNLCKQYGKPCLEVDLSLGLVSEVYGGQVATFLAQEKPQVVNIAGNRESRSPGIYRKTKKILDYAWKDLTSRQG